MTIRDAGVGQIEFGLDLNVASTLGDIDRVFTVGPNDLELAIVQADPTDGCGGREHMGDPAIIVCQRHRNREDAASRIEMLATH